MPTFAESTEKIVCAIREMAQYRPFKPDDRLFIDRSGETGALKWRLADIQKACDEIGWPLSQLVYVSQSPTMQIEAADAGAKWIFFHHYYISMARTHAVPNDYQYDDSGDKVLLLNSKNRPHRIALLSQLLDEPFSGRVEWSWRGNLALFENAQALENSRTIFPSAIQAISRHGAFENRTLRTLVPTARVEALAVAAQTTFLEIVAETNFEAWPKRITEKSFKPIAACRPFAIFGSAGTLDIIHDLGFETFGSLWDETYDRIEDHEERLTAFLKTIRYIMSLNFEDVKRNCKAICLRNQHHLITQIEKLSEERLESALREIWS
jgi:hypothetical protein